MDAGLRGNMKIEFGALKRASATSSTVELGASMQI